MLWPFPSLPLPIALAARLPLTGARTHSNPHRARNFLVRHANHRHRHRGLRSAYALRMLAFNRNELGGEFARDWVPVVRNRGGVIVVLCACGPFAEPRYKLRDFVLLLVVMRSGRRQESMLSARKKNTFSAKDQ